MSQNKSYLKVRDLVFGVVLASTFLFQNCGKYRSISSVDQGLEKLSVPLTIDEDPSFDFGNLQTGRSAQHTFTIANPGEELAFGMNGIGLEPPFYFKGGAYPGTDGTCLPVLAAGASCTIVVLFAPVVAGNFADSIEISYQSGETDMLLKRDVSGSASGASLAHLTLNPSATYSFGVVNIGSNLEQNIAVSNNSANAATALTVANLSAPFSVISTTCGTTLNAGASCTISVRYAPTAAVASTNSLSILYNNGSATQTMTLALTGTGAESATANPVYYSQVRSILQSKGCFNCHSMGTTREDLLAFKFSATMPQPTTPAIVPGNVAASRFAHRIDGTAGVTQMIGLSTEDTRTILTWIANAAPADPAGSITQSFRPLLGDRYYISSVLLKVYGADVHKVKPFTTPMSERMDLFGGACQTQDTEYLSETSKSRIKQVPFIDDCFNGNPTESRENAETVPQSGTVSENVRMATCLNIAGDATAGTTATALSRAGLTSQAPFDDASLTLAYQRFYPGMNPSASALASLSALGRKALTDPNVVPAQSNNRTLEGWRYIFLTLCMSSGWQAP